MSYDSNSADRSLLALAVLVALGVILHRAEALLPLPSPWIKLGLANIISLLALVFFGFKAACTVTVLRVILSSILGGTFLGPTFFLSLAGAAAAVAVMAIFYQQGRSPFSLLGVSVASACAHTGTVFFCVFLFLIPQGAFLALLPLFLALSLATGILNGWIANHLAGELTSENISYP